MKNMFLLLLCGTTLLACNSGSDTAKDKPEYTLADDTPALDTDSTTGADVTAQSHQPQIDTDVNKIGTTPTGGAVAAGAKLIEGSDCTSCHRQDMKLVGPAYAAVAEKYEATDANVSMLAKKVINGGKGNWGEIPMTPHPNLSEKDSEAMVRYILSLK
ncbi:c-type cytochrome [Hymenobacter aerilatus]|uniref:C-type cytochrome n=1 Tax=Hymenobacter aerilatus TaxID=2932251 RepID=A0A8T9SZ31_9BACT|nr:c-type cytochrome [Hymenobacter aerilatus]UOR05086.1 c-type cytochrome [Hymenobacter aerilatus]